MDYLDRFKTTPFGGFKKQDVLAFIDQMVGEYEQRNKQLEQELNQTKAVLELSLIHI